MIQGIGASSGIAIGKAFVLAKLGMGFAGAKD